MKNNTDMPEEQEGGNPKSNEVPVEEKTEPYSLFGVGGSRNENQKDKTDIVNRLTMETIEKDENGSINEESVEEDNKDTIGATDAMGTTGTMGMSEEDSQNNNEN